MDEPLDGHPRIVAAVGTCVRSATNPALAAAIEAAQVEAVLVAIAEGISIDDGRAIKIRKARAMARVLAAHA